MCKFGMLLALFRALLSPPSDSVRIMFWNLENFFDWRADSTSTSELEFSSHGERHWTRKRFAAKSNAVAKGILWTASGQGALPDVIGLAEVENKHVIKRLLQETALRKLDYGIIHFDSPDPRGIDVAMLYRTSRLRLQSAKPCHLSAADTLLKTRDILLAHFTDGHGTDIAVLVNHHPSKYGGTAVSEPKRKVAVQRLRHLADSLNNLGISRIVAIGDFNDTPDNPLYRQLDSTFLNLGLPLSRHGEGSIKYDGAWELIDLIFVTPSCKAKTMKIIRIPFLMVEDRQHGGLKPFRTYSGPRHIGGVSDHCPVWVDIPIGNF